MQNAPLTTGSSIGPAGTAWAGSGASDVVVEATRPRQTVQPSSPFRDVLAGSTAILARGAEVATSVVAGPVMAAAVREAGLGAATAVAGASGPGAMMAPTVGGTTMAGATNRTAGGTSNVPASLLASGSDQSDLATMQAMQRESQVFNMQLLELQEDVQQENRRFSTVSNVLRAKHDTAKAAVSNIRA